MKRLPEGAEAPFRHLQQHEAHAMKPVHLKPAVLALALLAASTGTPAADGWFGGLQVAPWVSRADALLNLDYAGGSIDLPQRKVHGSVLPAVPTHRFDVELAYAEDSSAGSGQAGRDFRLAGVGTWKLNDSFGFTGRVGAYRGDVDASTLYRLTPDAASLHPLVGMGMRYDISSNLRLQGGWDRYHLGISLNPGNGGVDLLTIGLKYRF